MFSAHGSPLPSLSPSVWRRCSSPAFGVAKGDSNSEQQLPRCPLSPPSPPLHRLPPTPPLNPSDDYSDLFNTLCQYGERRKKKLFFSPSFFLLLSFTFGSICTMSWLVTGVWPDYTPSATAAAAAAPAPHKPQHTPKSAGESSSSAARGNGFPLSALPLFLCHRF